MRIFLSLIIFLFCFNESQAQLKLYPELHLGIGFRFTPWFLESKAYTVNPYDFQYAYHDRKVRLAFDVSQSLLKNKRLSLQFSNNFTYTEFRKVKTDNSNPYLYVSDKTLKRDHFFDLQYTIIPKINNGGLNVGIGVGYMNCGTKFYYYKSIDTTLTNPTLQEKRKGTMRYISPRFIIGFKKKPFSIYSIFSMPPDNEGEKRATVMMDIKILYSFKVFKKEKTLRVFDN